MSVIVWEAVCAGKYSAWTVLHDFALRIPVEWLVRILVLASMTLQLVLVILGVRRYLSSSGILRFMVWGAYISADAVAVSALGTMMHSGRRGIYGIWAPLLLMHLGGPDAITAYSMADNELWLRHGFNMIYQVSVAAYVIYGSSLKGRPLAAALLLLLVGSIKYCERTLALRFGSYPRIVMSSLPISKYMEKKSAAENCRYVVVGEDQLEKMIEQEQALSPVEGNSRKEEGEASSPERGKIKEELEERRKIKEELTIKKEFEARGVVTIEDIERLLRKELEERGIVNTEEIQGIDMVEVIERVNIEHKERAKIIKREYNLCLSHALFKMYKRRVGSLYFFEGDHPQTRAFWIKRRGEEAFRLVEMELKFMYDAVFSKYTGFTKWGMVVRFLNTILMGAAGYLILRERESRQAQQTVTYVVISVALAVEVLQIWQVIVSDWTRVHLICANVASSRSQKSHIKRCRLKVINILMLVLRTIENVGGNRYWSKIFGDNRYWSNQIPQHCLTETWLNKSPVMWKVAGFFPKPTSFIVSWYTKLRHVHNVPIKDDLKIFIFDILKQICSQEYNSETCRQNVYNFEMNLFREETEILKVLGLRRNLEEVILIWHIATTLCDKNSQLPPENKTVEMSRILSRYCAYLLLSRPNLLPLHPKMARIVYMQLVNQLLDTHTVGSILQKNPLDLLRCNANDDLLGSGAKLAEILLKKNEKMWELLAQYWGKLVIYMAVYNKAIFHAECVAGGGEFLSLVWVLLGHMGCGEQSDSAVTKKVEMQLDRVIADRNVDPAAMETLRDRERELAATKEDLRKRENELAATKKDLRNREDELAVMKKNLSDREKDLAETSKGFGSPERELAATKKIVQDLKDELAATKKILHDHEEGMAASNKIWLP